tara:strand:+ start:63 stop:506 length:444 start_codon:yes stop_codon:yes gene_type:complete
MIVMADKWTIEDVLDPNSDFWIYSEDEIWEWLDRLPRKRQDEAFKNIEEWIAEGSIKLEDPPELSEPQRTIPFNETKRLQSILESDMVNVTMVNNMVALSAKNLPKLKEMKELMESHGNKFVEYRFRLNNKQEKVHTYIFIIDNSIQ